MRRNRTVCIKRRFTASPAVANSIAETFETQNYVGSSTVVNVAKVLNSIMADAEIVQAISATPTMQDKGNALKVNKSTLIDIKGSISRSCREPS